MEQSAIGTWVSNSIPNYGRHQAITWTSVDLSSMEICGTHRRPISKEVWSITSTSPRGQWVESGPCIWVRSRRCGCLVTWFCYQLIAKPGNMTAAPSWPDPYAQGFDHWHYFRSDLPIIIQIDGGYTGPKTSPKLVPLQPSFQHQLRGALSK